MSRYYKKDTKSSLLIIYTSQRWSYKYKTLNRSPESGTGACKMCPSLIKVDYNFETGCVVAKTRRTDCGRGLSDYSREKGERINSRRRRGCSSYSTGRGALYLKI